MNDRLAAAFQGSAPPDAFMQVSQRAQFYIGNGLTVPLDDVLADMRKVPGGIFENQLAVGQGRRHDPGAAARGRRRADVRAQGSAGRDRQAGARRPGTNCARTRSSSRQKHPQIAGFGMTVSNANDAEGQIRNVIWSFGGKVMAEDGKTVTFNSAGDARGLPVRRRHVPEGPHDPARRADLGRQRQQHRLPDRPRRLRHQPAERLVLDERQRQDAAAATASWSACRKARGRRAPRATRSAAGCGRFARRPSIRTTRKDWLRYFYQPEHYRVVIEKVGGRWAPIYPADARARCRCSPTTRRSATSATMAENGFMDGYAGPPNVLAGRVFDANILTKVLQKVLVDRISVDDAVGWGQKQIEELAKRG